MQYVEEILRMFSSLLHSYSKISNPTLKRKDLEFQGFDFNDEEEGKMADYAEYLSSYKGRYKDVIPNKVKNSHSRRKYVYLHMLKQWKRYKDPNNLNEVQIKKILNAYYNYLVQTGQV